jgi:DNA polymerase V
MHENTGISIHAGFPNPATDLSSQVLSLDRLLVPRPVSTFFLRVYGNNWEDRGIFDGDIIAVDRALNPRRTDLIIWWQEDGFVLSKLLALPNEMVVWGVVTVIIHQCRKHGTGNRQQ